MLAQTISLSKSTAQASALRAAGASMIGAVLSGTGIAAGAFAVFMQPISEQYGWGRAEVVIAISLMRWAGALSSPLIGRFIDQYGARAVVLPLTLLRGCALLAQSLANGSLIQFYLLYAALGLLSPGITPYSKVLAGWFDKRRGLALGSFGVGVFICAAVIPQLARYLLVSIGWKQAYVLLGAIVLLVNLPLLWLYFRERSVDSTSNRDAQPKEVVAGTAPAKAWRSRTYWLVVVSLGLSMFTFIGLQVHDISLFRDRGLTLEIATNMASIIAVGGMLAQVIVGYLLDRFDTPRIIVPFAAAASIGLLLIHYGSGLSVWIAGSILLGLGSGGETSMTSYYVTRFFGLKHFSQIYASIGFINTFTVGFAPVLIGAIYDRTQSYQWGLFLMEGALVLATLFFALLGPYQYASTGTSPLKTT